MSRFSRYSGLFFIVTALMCGIFGFSKAVQAEEISLKGWGWSSNIGHVSFGSESPGAGGGSYSVKLDTVTGDITGYAWSSSLGWLSFEPGDVAPCPTLTEDEGNKQARVKSITDGGTREVIGWARFINGDGSASNPYTGEWDGCVHLSSGANPIGKHNTGIADGTGGVTLVKEGANDKFVGFAWGGEVVGWLSFSPFLQGAGGTCATLGTCGGGGGGTVIGSCSSDIALVVDLSSSIDVTELSQMKSALKSFVADIPIDLDEGHMSVIGFQQLATMRQALTGSKTSVDNAIDSMTTGEGTNIHHGLMLGKYELSGLESNGSTSQNPLRDRRPDSTHPDYIVLLTDGVASWYMDGSGNPQGVDTVLEDPTALDKAVEEADAIKALGIEIYVVGINLTPDLQALCLNKGRGVYGDCDNFLANHIASSPTHYFTTNNLNDLDITFQNLNICPGGDPTPFLTLEVNGSQGLTGPVPATADLLGAVDVPVVARIDGTPSSCTASGASDYTGSRIAASIDDQVEMVTLTTGTVATTYTLSLVCNDGSSDTIQVIVNPSTGGGDPLDVACSVSDISGNPITTVEINTPVIYRATVIGGDSSYTYTWTGSGITAPVIRRDEPSVNTIQRQYGTTGFKNIVVDVVDGGNASATGECSLNPAINVVPKDIEVVPD